jgi:hypothetical protein
MSKIIELYKNKTYRESKVLNKIIEANAQEDLNEKKRKNKRTEKWDNLLFGSVLIFILLFLLIALGIIQLPPNIDYFLGAGGLTSIIGAAFRFVRRQNSS